MKKQPLKKSIADIIYHRLFYKNINIMIIASILFFIITSTLFIIYQLSIINTISVAIQNRFEILTIEAIQSKKLIQQYYYKNEDYIKDDSKILNDFHTILLSHNLITGIGFITESPRKYRYLYEYKEASKDKVNVKVFSKTSDLNKRTNLFLDKYYKKQ